MTKLLGGKMSDFTIDKSRVGSELLKRVAELVDKEEVQLAIALLQEALKDYSDSEVILTSLSSLYQQVVQLDIAQTVNERLLGTQAAQTQSTNVELPSEHDIDFLETQSVEISESEYSFDLPDSKPASPRKTLSLVGQKQSRTNTTVQKSKVIVKNKFRLLLDDQKPKDGVEEPLNTNVNVETDTNYTPPNHITDESLLNSIDTPIEEKEEVETTHESTLENAGASDVTATTESNSDLIDFVDALPDEAMDGLANEHFEDASESDGLEWVTHELTSFADQEAELDLLDSIELTSFTESENNEELSLYDYWDDALEEQYDEEGEEEFGALENTLTLAERARLIAVECVLEFNWDTSTLPFLVEVFTSRGWTNIRKALEREVAAGASFVELELAYDIKNLWQDSSRYWITFSKAYGAGESTDAAYRHCSWSQALRLIRVFEATPSYEEIYDFLEYEFEAWFNHTVLRKCFPAFTKYLFNYRLHERNVTRFVDGFSVPTEYENEYSLWSHYTHSDEVTRLRELGIDLASSNTPKNQFLSDKYTFDYLLEYWRSTTPESERGKYNEK